MDAVAVDSCWCFEVLAQGCSGCEVSISADWALRGLPRGLFAGGAESIAVSSVGTITGRLFSFSKLGYAMVSTSEWCTSSAQ